jgi:quercetin dioxygenase-like cupin family protein
MNTHPTLFRWEDLPLDKVTEMVSRKAISGREQLLVQTYFKKGAIVPLHVHAREQLIYVLQGAVAFIVDGREITAREGDVLLVPGGAAHQAEALDDTFVLHIRSVDT